MRREGEGGGKGARHASYHGAKLVGELDGAGEPQNGRSVVVLEAGAWAHTTQKIFCETF